MWGGCVWCCVVICTVLLCCMSCGDALRSMMQLLHVDVLITIIDYMLGVKIKHS